MSGPRVDLGRVGAVVTGVLVVAAFVMALAGIWTGDDRWGYTAMLTAFLAVGVGFVSACAWDLS